MTIKISLNSHKCNYNAILCSCNFTLHKTNPNKSSKDVWIKNPGLFGMWTSPLAVDLCWWVLTWKSEEKGRSSWFCRRDFCPFLVEISREMLGGGQIVKSVKFKGAATGQFNYNSQDNISEEYAIFFSCQWILCEKADFLSWWGVETSAIWLQVSKLCSAHSFSFQAMRS